MRIQSSNGKKSLQSTLALNKRRISLEYNSHSFCVCDYTIRLRISFKLLWHNYKKIFTTLQSSTLVEVDVSIRGNQPALIFLMCQFSWRIFPTCSLLTCSSFTICHNLSLRSASAYFTTFWTFSSLTTVTGRSGLTGMFVFPLLATLLIGQRCLGQHHQLFFLSKIIFSTFIKYILLFYGGTVKIVRSKWSDK